ncbi:putative secreted Zn-dependent protease [Pseudochrobactrum saccharolyticum]|uniref:Putative secreted Zn-dependent protease n=1 Tax=Pseudochrobactrum saccharolyticum TaxID=354352 RepID=A0A7W8ENV2_9HYPH|nr:DUF922 domain-containing protein [Pseudochrobactrum saccharolyticum]KAB0540417.1 DUF922 domain-containing protein [Pseudochrobactrum saccharolyticum]MBB5089953.1 putative secreted Zn-dependent protease [Pseudochrobactrum saccharolyticum]
MSVKSIFFTLLATGTIWAGSAQAEWQAIEKVETYTVSGTTGPELYASIGQKGPQISKNRRTIAHTNFTLLWSRKYKTDDGNCTLVSAKPKLTITYTLPKPAQKLPPETAALWATFYAGIEKHEHIHGDYIKEMVQKIETATVGMSVANDPKCTKFKTELNKVLSELFQEQRQRGRDFDRSDMAQGGNIHQLILGLVNGH